MPFKEKKDLLDYKKRLYAKNKKEVIKKVAERKKEIKKWLEDYKKNLKCSVCGETHPATIDFHHKNRAEKDNGVCYFVSNGYSKNRILQEMSKCEVLCANCHRKLHYKNNNL